MCVQASDRPGAKQQGRVVSTTLTHHPPPCSCPLARLRLEVGHACGGSTRHRLQEVGGGRPVGPAVLGHRGGRAAARGGAAAPARAVAQVGTRPHHVGQRLWDEAVLAPHAPLRELLYHLQCARGGARGRGNEEEGTQLQDSAARMPQQEQQQEH